MQCEIGRYPDVETGGILLGYATAHELQVLEAIDGGYNEVVREPGRFIYNADYANHLCNILSMLYTPQLELVGVWHKHNHSFAPSFSYEDHIMHKKLLMSVQHAICSILFQKQDAATNEYVMRTYVIGESGLHNEVEAQLLQ